MKNREIKFRIYNKDKKEFYYCDDLYFGITDEYIANDCFVSEVYRKGEQGKSVRDCSNDNVSEIQQFTGTKDSNGVEIYEGDILKWEMQKNGDNIVEVRWTEEGMDYDGWIFSNIWGQCGRHEVVGDIFRNPELLE